MSKKRKRKIKFSFKEAFCVNTNKLKSSLHLCPMLHVSTNGEIYVENPGAVVLYNENEVHLDMGSVVVAIKGDGITLQTMEKGLVTVTGRIFGIEFMYCKEKK